MKVAIGERVLKYSIASKYEIYPAKGNAPANLILVTKNNVFCGC